VRRARPAPRLAARLQLLAAAALFSTGGAAVKATTLTGWQVAGFRSGVAALAVLLLVPGARRGWSPRVALVGIAYAATMLLFVLANKLTTAANAIFLQATAPLYILLLGPWLLKERIRRGDLLFMAAVGLGLALFFVAERAPASTAPDPLRGDLLALGSGVCWAATVMGLRWLHTSGGGSEGSGLATVAVGNGIAFLVALPFALPVTAATPVDWGLIAYLGLFQIGLAYVFLTRGIEQVPALEASVLLLAEPALNPVWAWLVHGEVPGGWALAGGATILSATALRTWLSLRAAPAARKAVP